MKIKLLIKKIKYKIVKFLYNYFKKIYIRLSNLYDIDWKTTNDFKNKYINDITLKSYNNYIKNNKQ